MKLQVLELEPWNKEAKKELQKLKDESETKIFTEKENPQFDDKSTAEIKNEIIKQRSIPVPKNNVESKKRVEEKVTLQDTEKTSQGSETQGSSNEKRGKKLKILEVNSQEESRQQVPTDPNIVLPIDKPPHLRSTVS